MKLFDKLSALDIFGIRPTFYIRGKPKSASAIGLFLTWLSIIYFIWAFIYLSDDLINRTNPTVTQYNLLGVSINDPVLYGPNKFEYLFGIQDNTDQISYVNDTIYELSAILVDNNMKSHPIEIGVCNNTEILQYVPYNGSLFCVSDKQDISIQGVNGYLSINIKECNGTNSKGQACAPKEFIKSKLENSNLRFYFPIHSIIPTDYKNPIKKSWNYIDYLIDLTLGKVIYGLPKKLILKTEDGLLLTNVTEFSLTVHDKFILDLGSKMTAGGFFFINVWAAGDSQIISRRFQKIQDFLAQVVGLSGGAFAVATFLVTSFSRRKLLTQIAREIFLIEVVDKKNKKIPFKNSSDQLDSDINEDSFSESFTNLKRQKQSESKDSESHNRESAFKVLALQKSFSINIVEPHQIPVKVADDGVPSPRDCVSDRRPEPPTPVKSKSNQEPLGFVKLKLNNHTYNNFHLNSPPPIIEKPAENKTNLKEIVLSKLNNIGTGIRKMLRSNPDAELSSKVQEEIIRRLDIVTISKKLVEFDMLKGLLLNEDQRRIFDNLKKPKYRLKVDKDNNVLAANRDLKTDKWLQSFENKPNEADIGFKNLSRESDNDMINKRLVKRYLKQLKRRSVLHSSHFS